MKTLQKGFSIVAGIFLLVVLAALGAFMVSVSSIQHMSQAYDIEGTRAYHAAKAGIEWGMYRILQEGSCAATASFVPAAIAGYTVTVTCSASAATNEGVAADTLTIYELAATACNRPGSCPAAAPGDNYIERMISTRVCGGAGC